MRRSRPVAVAAAVGVALVVAACGGSHASLPARLRAWESGSSYSSDQGYITSDIQEIATGLRAGRLGAVRTTCDGLGFDAGTADGELPTPDEALTDDLNDEYLTATDAAQSCSTATTVHGRRIGRYLTLIARAERDRRAARARIAAILAS